VVGLNKLKVELTMGSGQKLCAEKNLTMLPNDLKYDTRYLKDILHESANGIAWSGNSIVDNDTIMKLQSVFFQLDKMDISDDMEPVLRKNTDIIRNYPGIKVMIGSFTHSDGDYDLNRSLSIKRSEAIRKYLVSRGISPNNLEVADPEVTRALENTCSDYLGCDYVDKGLNLRTDFKITRL
jgi:outer membrane protein OmpA-like peptidoglycan-associated protein